MTELTIEMPPCPQCGEQCTKIIGKHIFDTHTKEETSYYCFACNLPINATKREPGYSGTKKDIKNIRATVGAMRIQHERDGIWEPWWIKFVEWAETKLPSEYSGAEE